MAVSILSLSVAAVLLGMTSVVSRVRSARFHLEALNSRGDASSERGISTLEWILLVAAVGGIATLGILIVRRGYGEAGEQVDGEEAAGQLLAIATEDARRDGRNRATCSVEPPRGRLQQWSGIFTFKYTPASGGDPATCVPVHTNALGASG